MTIKMELALAQRAIEAGKAEAGLLQSARTITDGALHCVRDLSQLLHPALLDDLGLTEAVDWYLRRFTKLYDIQSELVHRLDERLSPEMEVSIYRVIQEALTNVAKHARAKTCRVGLRHSAGTLCVTVQDDGVGFKAMDSGQPPSPRGLGLIGIRERVAHLRGTVRIDSEPGSGTRLIVEVPFHVRASREAADLGAQESVPMTAEQPQTT